MKKALILVGLLIASCFPLAFAATDEGFGEDSEALGQYVDSFEDMTGIDYNTSVERNATLNAMQLNYTNTVDVVDNPVQLREHNFYSNPAWNPDGSFSIGGNDYVHISSTVAALGRYHLFLVADRAWLENKYVRWRWNGYYSAGSAAANQFWALSEASDRTNDAHFPFLDLYDKQLHFTNRVVGGASAFVTTELQMTNVSGAWNDVSLYWVLADGWSGAGVWMRVDWIEINTGAAGSGNLMTINFEDATNVVMENTGSLKDYGYVNNTGLPFFTGGYDAEGWFNSTDYLSDPIANGSALVQIANTSLPANTGIEMNYSNAYYVRYNFTSDDVTQTPILYQSRLITTQGNQTGGAAPGGGAGSGAIGFLMIILILVPIIGLLWRKLR
jgi:predicted small secreted protein